MDSETLKIILKLNKENTLLKRAVVDAYLMLHNRTMHTCIKYGMYETDCLFSGIKDILSVLNNKQQTTE